MKRERLILGILLLFAPPLALLVRMDGLAGHDWETIRRCAIYSRMVWLFGWFPFSCGIWLAAGQVFQGRSGGDATSEKEKGTAYGSWILSVCAVLCAIQCCLIAVVFFASLFTEGDTYLLLSLILGFVYTLGMRIVFVEVNRVISDERSQRAGALKASSSQH